MTVSETSMPDLGAVYTELRAVLAAYGSRMAVRKDIDGEYYVETGRLDAKKKPVFFGAVQLRRQFVSYHLMPVYTHPELLDGISPRLKARMQGKSCFNFKVVDPALFRELAELTERGFIASGGPPG